MQCEPNENLPQTIDWPAKEETPTENSQEEDSSDGEVPKAPLHQEGEYNILPKFVGHQDYLDEVLSIKKNRYLACRWDQFLEEDSQEIIKIRLHRDYLNSLNKPVPRRKTLTGQFYGVDYKLAPVPVSLYQRTQMKYAKSKEASQLNPIANKIAKPHSTGCKNRN